ncbi:HIT family protein [Macrococcus brunensis]|uniref:HIT family protein n=1 Tax=Macrococcus brunensis TaxID=198483 RepID=UPI001EF0508C|nr:HIT family protein [Macrococcus brunensis]ULG70899.1 HIT family protein [Macrococcus brunensis]
MEESCIFCHHLKKEQILMASADYKVLFDIDPIQYGHLLIVARRHVMNFNELTEEETADLVKLQKVLITLFEDELGVGVTVVFNNGKMMDQHTHFHVHLIPRYSEDGFWDKVDVEMRDSHITSAIEHIIKKTADQ